jgi:hypothetical protein
MCSVRKTVQLHALLAYKTITELQIPLVRFYMKLHSNTATTGTSTACDRNHLPHYNAIYQKNEGITIWEGFIFIINESFYCDQ